MQKKKTILDQGKLKLRRLTAIAGAFALAAALTGCDPAPNNDNSQTTYEHEEIAQLADQKDATLVQGRDNAIKAMVAGGMSQADAEKACDDVMKEALAKQQQDQQGTNATTQPTTAPVDTNSTNPTPVGVTPQPVTPVQPMTIVNNYNNSSGNNALLWWFLINNNRPVVYYGTPSSGLTYYGGWHSGTSHYAAPPRVITHTQTEYLVAPHSERASISAKLAARPGAKLTPVHITSTPKTTTGGMGTKSTTVTHTTPVEHSTVTHTAPVSHGATSHGGMSGSHGVSGG